MDANHPRASLTNPRPRRARPGSPARRSSFGIVNALCFDIDDLVNGYTWYWGGNPPHADYVVEKETAALLETLAEWNLRTTMFVPGYVAERFGRLVKDIAAAGHDIASHGG